MSYTYKQPRRAGIQSGRPYQSGNKLLTFLVYLVPFVLINGCIFYLATAKPKLDVTLGDSNDYITSVTTIKIKSLLPTTSLTASMDSEDIELEKVSRKEYTATVKKNGVLEISAKNFNGMITTDFEQISNLDDNPPSISSNEIESGILTIVMEDTQSGIDYDSIYATDSTGANLKPLSLDKTNQSATFKMDPAGLTVFVKDAAGHQVQANYTSVVEEAEEKKTTEKSSTEKNSSTKNTSSKNTTTKTSTKNQTSSTLKKGSS